MKENENELKRMKDFKDMTKEELEFTLQTVAEIIERIFLPENYGFILMTYPHDKAERAYYVSNSNREDVVKAMQEFIKKTETTWGMHVENKEEKEDGNDN